MEHDDAPSEISPTRSEQGRIADLERQLKDTLSKQSKREKQVEVLTGQLNTLLERAEADVADAAEAKQPDQRDLQAYLLQSHDQALEEARSALQKASSAAVANEQSQRELAGVVNAMKSESAGLRLRLENLENDKSRNQAATGRGDMDQVISEISERLRALEVGQTSRLRHDKRLADVDNSNE